MASALHWIPDSLYNSAMSAVVANYSTYMKDVRTFPESVLFDVFYKLYKEGRLCQLSFEFSNLEIFDRLLKVQDKRNLLHNAFQALMDHGSQTAVDLANTYVIHCGVVKKSSSMSKSKAIQVGFSLSDFLSDAGWFPQSEKVIVACLKLLKSCKTEDNSLTCLQCYVRLLHVRNVYCKFCEAKETFKEAKKFIEQLKLDHTQKINFAAIYAEFSKLFYYRSIYNESYIWIIRALQELSASCTPKVVVDVLRQASKVCVVKREFKKAGMLIKQAVHYTREWFGVRHTIMADTLLDYGFYLLNVDNIWHSIKVYQAALDTRMTIFGGKNLLVAVTHEDLAYATYIFEYSSGRFKDSREHAEKSMEIMTHLLHSDHLLLASCKRVKALILEEIAIDNIDNSVKNNLLHEAQELHFSALNSTKKCFGEMNVQIAKHYGNLGRLYQSMKKFDEAKEMHLKAIHIKEKIMGHDDYEVALSLGHLASLYNYDMCLYEEAKTLYWRSINIGIKLFGKEYSGLEYEYRGLLRVYSNIGDTEGVERIMRTFSEWKMLRHKAVEAKEETSPLNISLDPIPAAAMYDNFVSEL